MGVDVEVVAEVIVEVVVEVYLMNAYFSMKRRVVTK